MSVERFSLVHDRCTTCGSLLPCALHDREMKRGMLSEGEERWPELKIEWRHEHGEALQDQVVRMPDGSFIYLLWNGSAASFFVERIEKTADRKWALQFTERLPRGMGRLIAHQFGVFEVGGDLIRLHSAKNFNLLEQVTVGTIGLRTVLFERVKNGIVLNHAGLLKIFTKTERGFELTCMVDDKGNTIASPKFIHRITDTEYFLLNEQFYCCLISAPDDGSKRGWQIHPMLDKQQQQFWLGVQESTMGKFCTLDCDEPRLARVSSIGKIKLIEHDPSAPEAWHTKTIGDCNYYFVPGPSTINSAENRCTDIVPASPHDFFTFHKDGSILHWNERANGTWQRLEIKWADEDGIVSAHLISSDPPAFMIFSSHAVTLYCIQPDDWRAFHERQAQSAKIPPLPSDL